MNHWIWVHSEPVDLSSLVVRPMNHEGDSEIWSARSRKKPNSVAPSPRFLVKRGKDAINERIASWLAERYNVPHQVVRWSSSDMQPEVAIRFEPEAYRPYKLDVEAGTAITNGVISNIINPLDYYRHLALASFLEEADGEEFMVMNGLLFRIDAAATCYGAHRRIIEIITGVDLRTEGFVVTPAFIDYAEHLKETSYLGYSNFRDMLECIANDADLANGVINTIEDSLLEEREEIAVLFAEYIEERRSLIITNLSRI